MNSGTKRQCVEEHEEQQKQRPVVYDLTFPPYEYSLSKNRPGPEIARESTTAHESSLVCHSSVSYLVRLASALRPFDVGIFSSRLRLIYCRFLVSQEMAPIDPATVRILAMITIQV